MDARNLVTKNHCSFSIDPIKGKNAELTQEIGCDAVKDYHYWITSGNLLGIYRDKKLIDFDTDIDIGILLNEGDNPTSDILEKLKNINFTLIRSVFDNDSPMQLAFMDNDRQVIFDIYFFYRQNNIAVNYNPEGYIEKPLKFIEELGSIEFQGKNYPVPNYLEEYLVWRFGDWKVPATNKVAWQTEAKHLKKWEK